MNRWWYRLEDQYYWFELTKRDYSEMGKNLQAPKTNYSNKDYWSYSILKEMREDDYVLHYHKNDKAIIGVSQVAKPWVTGAITWAPDRKKREQTKPSFKVELKNYKKISPITLDQIRKKREEVEMVVKGLVEKYNAAYFPFVLPKSNKRRLSLNEGYGFIVTQEFVDLFPKINSSFDKGFQEPKLIEGTEDKSLDNKKKKKTKKKISSAKNEAIELYAVEKAVKYLIEQNYKIERMPRKSFPYDLKATKSNIELHVEVKGKSDTGEKVIVSRNEVKHSKNNPQNSVFILVHSIKANLTAKGYRTSGGKLVVKNPWALSDEELNPYTYEYFVK